MKVFKGKYGWSTSAHSKNVMGEQVKCYMDVNFRKDEEPMVDAIEGKLIFRQDDGSERECFLSSYEKKIGNEKVVIPKIVMLSKIDKPRKKMDEPSSVQTVLSDGKKDILGHTEDVVIDTEELPFY